MEPKKLLVKYLSLTYDEREASHKQNVYAGFDPEKHKYQYLTGNLKDWAEDDDPSNWDIANRLWRYVDKETELMTRPLVIGDEEFIMWDEPEEPNENMATGGYMEAQIKAGRGETYGDFDINMEALTHTIEAMVWQTTQTRVKLPSYFGALVMCQAKILRECYQHKEDNGLDHHNYLGQARKMAEEGRGDE